MTTIRRGLATALLPVLGLLVWAAPAHAAALAITSPDSGEDATPLVAGVGQPGTEVHVQRDGTDVCVSPVAGDETWSCEVSPALPLGESTTLEAVSVLPSDGSELERTSYTYSVWPAAATITITDPRPGATLGTGVEGAARVEGQVAELDVWVDGAKVDGFVGQEEGTRFTFFVRAEVSGGPHTLQIRGTDGFGRDLASNVVPFVLDDVAPAAPVVTSPAPGSRLTAWPDTFSGTGTPGDTVHVAFDGSAEPVTQRVTVGADGRWSTTEYDWNPAEANPRTVFAGQNRTFRFLAFEEDPFGNRSVTAFGLHIDLRTAAGGVDPTPTTTPTVPAAPARPAAAPVAAAAELANTGPEDAGTGGLLGGSLVVVGTALVIWTRRTRPVLARSSEDGTP